VGRQALDAGEVAAAGGTEHAGPWRVTAKRADARFQVQDLIIAAALVMRRRPRAVPALSNGRARLLPSRSGASRAPAARTAPPQRLGGIRVPRRAGASGRPRVAAAAAGASRRATAIRARAPARRWHARARRPYAGSARLRRRRGSGGAVRRIRRRLHEGEPGRARPAPSACSAPGPAGASAAESARRAGARLL
jgi:hypothetical protein